MPSHSRALEASFESSDKPAAPLRSDPGPMLEDFDTFFEKLSTQDSARWRKDDSLLSGRPSSPPEAKAAPTRERKAPATPPPASGADPLAGLRAAFTQARKAQAAEKIQKPAVPRRMVPGVIRFAATAVVLFAGGMGIGWLALSLPGKLHEPPSSASAPANGLIVEQKADALLTKPIEENAEQRDKTGAVVPLAEVGPGTPPKADSSAKPAEPPAAQAGESLVTLPVDLAAAQAAETLPGQGSGETKPLFAAAATAAEPVVPREPTPTVQESSSTAKPHAKANRASKSAPTVQPPPAGDVSAVRPGARAPRYAVQVGACRSAHCVDTYRKLVSAHLTSSADQIQVVAVPSEGKDSGVQRVRVAPLDKAQAHQLRAALIEADPRLSEAYVVEFHP